MNSYGQIPQRSIQNACTCIQPQSLQEVVLKHKSLGRAVTWGEGRQTQTELMLLALNEDQPELHVKGQPAESVWDASHLQATGTDSALTHITTHQLPNWAPILTSTEAEVSTSEWPRWTIGMTAATQFGPLQTQLSDLTATVRSFFPLSNRTSMLPPACQCLTTLSSYITPPALNPTPVITRGCACSTQFNSTKLYQVASIHSFLSTCIERLLNLALGIQKWNIRSPDSQDSALCARMLEHKDRGLSHSRWLPTERWNEWDQRISKDRDTQSDIPNGPS